MEENFDDLPKSRKEAIKANSNFYFTGEPCLRGHLDKRYTKCSTCRTCKRNNSHELYHRTKEETRPRREKYNKWWADTNIERRRETKRQWRQNENNKQKEQKYERERKSAKSKNDPIFRLNCAINSHIREALKTLAKGKTLRPSKYDTILPFTIQELKNHLENLWKKDMNWNNYTKYWVVDHIKPLSKCEDFDESWSLDNLQPLTVIENRYKGDKWREIICVEYLKSVNGDYY